MGVQVAGVDMADGIAQVQLAEMVVAGLALRYVDRKSGEARDEGHTRPEVIMRQLTTRPGQVEPSACAETPPFHSKPV